MGHHIDSEGRFQSDKHPDLPPDKIILSFKDPHARVALGAYAKSVRSSNVQGDVELADDISFRIYKIKKQETSCCILGCPNPGDGTFGVMRGLVADPNMDIQEAAERGMDIASLSFCKEHEWAKNALQKKSGKPITQ